MLTSAHLEDKMKLVSVLFVGLCGGFDEKVHVYVSVEAQVMFLDLNTKIGLKRAGARSHEPTAAMIAYVLRKMVLKKGSAEKMKT